MTTSEKYDGRLLADASLWRDSKVMRSLLERIKATTTQPWNIMEVCGGQTFTLSRYRFEELLPSEIKMVHGPGCPVCVTPAETIDAAIELALRPDVILCSFGDMMRVPGNRGSLLRAKAEGADIRLLYSPLDALKIAVANPGKQVVFFAIGFETTAPLYAMLAEKAAKSHIPNFSLLTSLFTVPPAVRMIKNDSSCQVDALLGAGHVCAVTGMEEYHLLAQEFSMPVVITGFEPVDMLLGILHAVEMLEAGEVGAVNAYPRAVHSKGNPVALGLVCKIFEPSDAEWRGIGTIPASGLKLREDFKHIDAATRFNLTYTRHSPQNCAECIAGKIMKGLATPGDCPHFAKGCTPQSPLGAPMVSGEGTCAAYYRYNR